MKGTGTLQYGEGLPWEQWYGDSKTKGSLETNATKNFRSALEGRAATHIGDDTELGSRDSSKPGPGEGVHANDEEHAELLGRTVHRGELLRSSSPVLDAALRDAERRRAQSPGLGTSRKSLVNAIGAQSTAKIIAESHGTKSPFEEEDFEQQDVPATRGSNTRSQSPLAFATQSGSLPPSMAQSGSDSEHEMNRGATPVRRRERYEDSNGIVRRVVATPVQGRAIRKAEGIHREGRLVAS